MPGAARFHVWVCLRAKTVKWKQAGPPGSRPPLHKQTGTFRLRREEISYKFPAKTILRHSFPLTPRGQTQHVQLCRGFFFFKVCLNKNSLRHRRRKRTFMSPESRKFSFWFSAAARNGHEGIQLVNVHVKQTPRLAFKSKTLSNMWA